MTTGQKIAAWAASQLRSDRKGLLRHVRPVIFTLVLVAVVALDVSFAVNRIGFLRRTELFIEDVERSIYTPAEPQQPDIVIVTIDDSTLSGFPYSSPIDRGFLNDLIHWLAAQSPRAIGIDILFDQPTEPNKDVALKQTLATLPMPLVVSYTRDPDIETADRQAYLDAFVPPTARGVANLAEDPFDTARYILEGAIAPDGKMIPSFPRRIAMRLGITPPPGTIEIAWRGSPNADSEPFKMYPAQIVRVLDPAFFRNKVILIGSNFSITDRHRTPFAAVYEGTKGSLPGIVIQAHALAQLLERRPPDRPHRGVDFAITCLLALLGAVAGRVERSFFTKAAISVAVVVLFWIGAFMLFHNHRILIELLPPSISLMAMSWIAESLSGQQARKQREFIRSSFSQYVPAKVVKELIQTPERLSLVGQRRELTLMFTDVAGFTGLSEGLGASELGVLVNLYLDGMCRVLFDFDGTVLKFIGDAVFSIFNAPTDQSDHAARAVRCAIEINRFAEAFRAEQVAQGVPFGVTRIGVHTGDADVGNFGSLSRKEYGAMGDSVNVSSRLESSNKFFGTHLCVSGETAERCPDIAFRPLADVILKGKIKPIPVLEPLDTTTLPKQHIERYLAAYRMMAARDAAALDLFEALALDCPDDRITRIHLDRLRSGEVGTTIIMTEK